MVGYEKEINMFETPLLITILPLILLIFGLTKIKRKARTKKYQALSSEEKKVFQKRSNDSFKNGMFFIVPASLFLVFKEYIGIQGAFFIALLFTMLMKFLLRKKG
ncbi:MAG: hypothetical protein ABIJ43_04710 [Candidatus Beckwithbacteria bacterium]|nr:hypothetical protein [Patescibacteria group bacterium]